MSLINFLKHKDCVKKSLLNIINTLNIYALPKVRRTPMEHSYGKFLLQPASLVGRHPPSPA